MVLAHHWTICDRCGLLWYYAPCNVFYAMRTCEFEGCDLPVFGTDKITRKGYCGNHQYCRTDRKPRIMKKPKQATSITRKPIKKISDKLKKALVVYNLKRKIYLMEHPVCEANLVGCSKQATTIHHMKGRGVLLNAVEFWMGACMNCHRIIEQEPEMAKQCGFSVSRLKV